MNEQDQQRLGELNDQLVELRDQQQKHAKSNRLQAQLIEEIQQHRAREQQLEARVNKERGEVTRLEGMSLTGLFYSVLGSKEQQIEKERQELLEAELKLEQCTTSLREYEALLEKLKQASLELGDPEQEIRALLDEKEEIVSRDPEGAGHKLSEIQERLGTILVESREVDEAIRAGDSARRLLDATIEELNSASSWGTWDMVGGGLIATAIKHSKIDAAKQQASGAQQALDRFARELRDVDRHSTMEIEIGSFNTFADYFLDGLIFDWVVQSKIQKSRASVKETRARVDQTLVALQSRRRELTHKKEELDAQRQQIVESS